MLIVVEQLLLKFDDIQLVKADYESETKTMQQFRWLKPKTWFLPPIVEENKKYHVEIFYVRDGENGSFQLGCPNAASAITIFNKIAAQIKLQYEAQNQEVLDKLFEDAIRNAND